MKKKNLPAQFGMWTVKTDEGEEWSIEESTNGRGIVWLSARPKGKFGPVVEGETEAEILRKIADGNY